MILNSLSIMIISLSLYYSPTCMAQALEVISDQMEGKSAVEDEKDKDDDFSGNGNKKKDNVEQKSTYNNNVVANVLVFLFFVISFYCVFKFLLPWVAFGSHNIDIPTSDNQSTVVGVTTPEIVINTVPQGPSIEPNTAPVGGSNVKQINVDGKLADRIARDFSYNIYRMVKVAQAISVKTTPLTSYEKQLIYFANKFFTEEKWQEIIDWYEQLPRSTSIAVKLEGENQEVD